MLHGILIDDLILFFHEPFDINLVFCKDIFESEQSLFACIEGNFMLFELGISRQEFQLIKAERFFYLIGGGFFVRVLINLRWGDGALEWGDLVVEVENETYNRKRETFDVSGAFGDDPKIAIRAGQVMQDTNDEISVNIFSTPRCIL